MRTSHPKPRLSTNKGAKRILQGHGNAQAFAGLLGFRVRSVPLKVSVATIGNRSYDRHLVKPL